MWRVWISCLLLGVTLADIGVEFPPDYSWMDTKPIDEYVHTDDGFWSYTLWAGHHYEQWDMDVYIYNMTSQKWMDEDLVDRPVWWHIMSIAVPKRIQLKHRDFGFLYIEGGSNNNNANPPDRYDEMNLLVAEAAAACGCFVGSIGMVPNQPLYFANDITNERRTEDEIISWTWHTYLDDPEYYKNPNVVLRLPMTKAAKRGLDTIAAVAFDVRGETVTRFAAAGGSKRGWTTWSLAVADPRMIAAAPLVMSLLNMTKSLDYHNRALGGGWSFALKDYFEVGLTRQFFDPNVILPGGLWDHEDMYRYRSRLGLIPRLSVAGTGDEFFFPQDFLAWYEDMPGPASQHLMMVANAEHSLAPWYRRIMQTVQGWLLSILDGVPLPKLDFSYNYDEFGVRMFVNTDVTPINATAYVGYTLNGSQVRDFRLVGGSPPEVQLIAFRKEELTDLGDGQYTFRLNNPGGDAVGEPNWGAMFIAMEYDTIPEWPMKLTTPVIFTPDTFPVESCDSPDSCEGWLC